MNLKTAANNLARIVEQSCLEAVDTYFVRLGNEAMPKLLRQAIKDVDEAKDERIVKFEVALKELSGFAERNSKRAEAAWRAAMHSNSTQLADSRDVARAEARWHEANRVHSVIRDRVKEALVP